MDFRLLVAAAVVWMASYSVIFSQEAVAANFREQGIHHKEGVSCKDCHGVDKPKEEAKTKLCLDCHGPYSKLAERTRKKVPNPHDHHMGPIDCVKCHGVHEPMEPENIPCVECHSDFELKTR